MKKAAPSASIRLPFDWIDTLAVPVATSIMETQPFVVVLLFFALLFTGKSASVPLDAVSITLLMLGLHWWAQLVKHMTTRRGLGDIAAGAFQFFGLLLALALTIVSHPALLNDMLVLLFVTALVLWFWIRGRRRAQVELSEEQLLFSFKLCFGVLLAVLLITIPLNLSTAIPLSLYIAGTTLATIVIALPLFFVSGLIALSFIRLSITRHEYRRDTFGTRLNRTHAWSLFLALTWSMLVVVTILLESFSFQPLLTIFTPLINAIDNAALFFWQLFAQGPQPKPPARPEHLTPVSNSAPGQTIPLQLTLNPLIIIVILVIFAVIVLAGIIFIVFAMLLARDKRREEEQRESLNVSSTLNERRKRNKQRKTKFRLETLDPNSVRARYRDLLFATARRGGDIQRHPQETPTEYQSRLLSVVSSIPNKEGEPSNAAILTELTEAYTLERYGRKPAEQARVGYFKRWVQHLIKRIKRSKKI